MRIVVLYCSTLKFLPLHSIETVRLVVYLTSLLVVMMYVGGVLNR